MEKSAERNDGGKQWLFLIKVNYMGVVGSGGGGGEDKADSVFDVCHQKRLVAEAAPECLNPAQDNTQAPADKEGAVSKAPSAETNRCITAPLI